MKITELHVDLLRVPPTIQLQDAIQSITTWEFVLVTLRTDTGVTARGWSYSLGMGGAAVRELIDVYLRPLLIGADPRNAERIWQRCAAELHAVGNAGVSSLAIAAVDIAVWDAVGKSLELPLYRLWGAYQESTPAYASGLNLHLQGDELAEQLTGYLDKGNTAVKVKIGRDDLEEDVERLATARATVGNKVAVFVDANQKWRAGEAIRRVSALERFAPAWIEEPVLAEDLRGNVHVRSALSTPVALGESLFTRMQFADYIHAGAVDIVQADVARVGGFTEWLKIAHLASSFNLQMAPHYMSELSVHLLCAIENAYILEDIEGGTLFELGLATEPVQIVDGRATPSGRPGHGVVFDESAIERHKAAEAFEVIPTRH
ncbi:mandelate racemase/muconate lactonizing enzyme family protein [Streptomyces yatensis]|uniref:Mandelate racemase/muconate lactonizing enzyme family protein n=1 Tax=Streptomyces yatensis TaxID=155177 RepID=A0ABN2I3T1_9ACTN|nr:mandelate racemase/muconate lactonizing enzyme family protein [Streptomyces yatensis]